MIEVIALRISTANPSMVNVELNSSNRMDILARTAEKIHIQGHAHPQYPTEPDMLELEL